HTIRPAECLGGRWNPRSSSGIPLHLQRRSELRDVPRYNGHAKSANTPFQKARCRKPIVKSHPPNHASPTPPCCSIRILSVIGVSPPRGQVEQPVPSSRHDAAATRRHSP